VQARPSAPQAAGPLNAGRANTLIPDLSRTGSNGDAGTVQAFLNEVAAYLNAGILSQDQADALLGPGNTLLLGLRV
jgi:hypothetical protein